jgi:hypothetical protein
VGTGQSLSIGGLGTPIMAIPALDPTANNLKLSLGGATVPPFDPSLGSLAMVPLAEPIRPTDPAYPSAYPGNIDGETPHTAMASQITALVRKAGSPDYITVHTVVGESGQPMTVINKTATEVVSGTTSMGRAYAATLFEAAAISRLAGLAGKTYGVGAIIITHGEADAGNPNYESDQAQLWSDYNQDLKAITHQTDGIPMLVSQQNSTPSNAGSTSASALAQWHVGVSHPRDLICIGPKYQYPYNQDNPGGTFIHLSAHGYELLGEKFGQVFYERTSGPTDWASLSIPTSEFVAAGSALAGRDLSAPRDPQVVMPAPGNMANLLGAQNAISNLAENSPHRLADVEHLGRVVHVAPAELGDVDQAVHPVEVDERAEVDDVRDLALDHVPW